MNKSITFTKDILESVALKNNIPLEFVKYSFDIMLKNMERLVKSTDATSIFIPEIGTLFANYERLNAQNNYLLKKGFGNNVVQAKLENIESFSVISKKNTNYRVNRHLQKKFLNNNFFTKGLKVEEIEKIQNETRG